LVHVGAGGLVHVRVRDHVRDSETPARPQHRAASASTLRLDRL
jgi:hypothetical protein